MIYMWQLIKFNLNRKESYLYWCCVILILYVLGVGMASHYVNFYPSVLYLNSFGTGVYWLSSMMIVLTAVMFTGTKNKCLDAQWVKANHNYSDIFWSKLVTLFIYYIVLGGVLFGSALVAEKVIFKQKYLSFRAVHNMCIALGANFMLSFLLVCVTVLLSSLILSIKNTIVAGFGFQYIGSVLAAPIMILLYHHQWLKWNPFNCLFVQFQINKPINHAMTKLSMPDVLVSVALYGILYLMISYLIFVIYNHKSSKTQP